ncbi:class I SAM-dependent methyltransferase [Klenkia sp. PcliD-1-E]|uniref:O-methyltransferase n=1 Tax=Klenkia sp. PcliD-1-E TaxID=2954492 RepID=UPI00209711A2|nr:class I SAM-dependent methyltransferase [Klenkia sp. PcliD-1-E]MCO7221776.1 class I SAM-dependent methyltransferase [Klenkia sp. PcliD-1-E]
MTAGLRPVTPLGILAARLDAACARLDGLEPGLRAELEGIRDLAVGLEPYLERHTTPESPELAALAGATRAAPWSGALEAEMLSGHVEGRFLQFLLRLTGARRVLELGMFTGYSALAMAQALPEGGEVVACELDPEVAAFAQRCFPPGAAIDVRVGPAADTLGALAAEGQVFDVVFVDADKAGYAGYLDAVLDGGLLAPDGLVAVDNTLMQGQPWAGPDTPNGAAIAAFNDRLTADPRVEQVLVPLRDGITLVRRTTPPPPR